MPDTFVISGLHRKRAHLAGEIDAAQRALTAKRDMLATLDSVIRLFEPESDPELIPAIRPTSRRCLYFRRAEQMRLALAATGGGQARQHAAHCGVCHGGEGAGRGAAHQGADRGAYTASAYTACG
jgi:cytochrome c553